MKKAITFLFGAMALSSVFLFASCDNKPQSENSNIIDDQSINQDLDNRKQIYLLAKESGYTGTYEEWLESIRGAQIELVTVDNVLKWKYSNEPESAYRVLFDFSSLIEKEEANPNIYEDFSYSYEGSQIRRVYLKVDTENHTISEKRDYFDGIKWTPYYGIALTVTTYKNTIEEVLKKEVTIWDYEQEKEGETYTSYSATYDDNDNLILAVWKSWDSDEKEVYSTSKKEYSYDNEGKQTTIESNWDRDKKAWVLYKKYVNKETTDYYFKEEYSWSIDDNKWIGDSKQIYENNQHYYYHWNYELDDWELETY